MEEFTLPTVIKQLAPLPGFATVATPDFGFAVFVIVPRVQVADQVSPLGSGEPRRTFMLLVLLVSLGFTGTAFMVASAVGDEYFPSNIQEAKQEYSPPPSLRSIEDVFEVPSTVILPIHLNLYFVASATTGTRSVVDDPLALAVTLTGATNRALDPLCSAVEVRFDAIVRQV